MSFTSPSVWLDLLCYWYGAPMSKLCDSYIQPQQLFSDVRYVPSVYGTFFVPFMLCDCGHIPLLGAVFIDREFHFAICVAGVNCYWYSAPVGVCRGVAQCVRYISCNSSTGGREVYF